MKRLGSGGKRLGHTAGQHEDAVGVIAAAAAQKLAQLAVAFAGDGAGIDDHNGVFAERVPRRVIARLKARRRHQSAHRLCLILIDLAAQGVKKRLHVRKFSLLTKSTPII